ncbi:MAG TPA: pirin family protein [Burkholderiales bacterium]|nr:pirin family protein [Burkholderiales bacterium]
MVEIRRSEERGHADHGWLDSYHSFSFADYYDPEHVAFGALRVINEDRVQPGRGFGTHGHRDMEIVSYVLSGALEHKDNLGTGSIIRPGDVQRMSAGTGVLHSEFNPSSGEVAHFLQIWIMPKVTGIPPGYEQKHFSDGKKRGRLALIASADGRDGSVTVNQDVSVYAGLFNEGETALLDVAAGRLVYIHVARGSAIVNGNRLNAGDALKVTEVSRIMVKDGKDAELLVFDLA